MFLPDSSADIGSRSLNETSKSLQLATRRHVPDFTDEQARRRVKRAQSQTENNEKLPREGSSAFPTVSQTTFAWLWHQF